MRAARGLGSARGALLLAAALLAGCASLPPLDERSVSSAFTDTADTRLGHAVQPAAQAHPGSSGVLALADGRDAFAARLRLAEAAERSLDVQYYLWRNDMSGTLLFEALRRAAERGVRVRLLLDDNNTTDEVDDALAVLDAEPNVEVRLFNPFPVRRWRAFGFLGDFPRLNRRMHNKSFTADNQVTIVGGRNIGDNYFGAADDVLFVDLDVLAVGPVVHEVSADFDRYWVSASAYPAARVLPPADAPTRDAVRTRTAQVERDPAAQAYLTALAGQPFVRALEEHRLPFEWVPVQLVSDDPAKGLGRAAEADLLASRLRRVVGAAPRRELELVSSYFVPGERGTEYFAGLARRGVKVVVLTNSLAATDVMAVHAGYARWREPLVEAGVVLYEMKPTLPRGERQGLGSSSAASLHAKTFSIDRERVFVGSFNIDPRSARLNTELGLVIDSPALARTIADSVVADAAERAWRVRLDDGGRLQWVESQGGREIVHDTEPGSGFWRRLAVRLMSLLPLDWLL
ncbi:MAG TPA: phospholipase D family protein [Burkholderiaceae bacterium]